MTSDDSLSLILRRLEEIERKLDRIMEEYGPLRPLAIRRAGAIVQEMIEASVDKSLRAIQAKAYPLEGPTSGRHYLPTAPR
jgi:hypothetical protein